MAWCAKATAHICPPDTSKPTTGRESAGRPCQYVDVDDWWMGETVSAEQIVRAEMAAWGRNDVDEVMSHFADDLT